MKCGEEVVCVERPHFHHSPTLAAVARHAAKVHRRVDVALEQLCPHASDWELDVQQEGAEGAGKFEGWSCLAEDGKCGTEIPTTCADRPCEVNEGEVCSGWLFVPF